MRTKAKMRTKAGMRTKKETAKTKPVVKRRNPPQSLATAPLGECFWVNQGPILKDLRELRDALASGISDQQLAYHVAKGKNDFADWIAEVLGDAECAKALRRLRTRKAMVRVLETRLSRYQLD